MIAPRAREVGVLDEPEDRALGVVHRPATRCRRPAGRPAGGRRSTPRSRRCSRSRERCTAVANPSSQSCRARKALAAGGSPRAAGRRAGRRTRPTAAATGCRRSSPLPETSTTTTSSRSPSCGARRPRSHRRTGCRRRSAAPTRRTSRSGRSGRPPWRWIRSRRSTSIDSPAAPATPRRDRRNEASSTMKPEHEDDDDLDAPCARTTARADAARPGPARSSMSTTNQGSCRGPSDQAATASAAARRP